MKNTTLMISDKHVLFEIIFQLNKLFHFTNIYIANNTKPPTLIRATSLEKMTNRKFNLKFIELINF